MNRVHAKKRLGQHFLTDTGTADKIAGTLSLEGYCDVLEIGPGTGALTKFLIKRDIHQLVAIEIDEESLEYLGDHFPELNLIRGDFLNFNPGETFKQPFAIIGNFPYNISSQIFFRVLDMRDSVVEISGMLQKEVAQRICSGPGSKTYGILSVLLQTFFDVEYLFEVSPDVFYPKPKVVSAVIRLRRNNVTDPGCDFSLMRRIVKATFNQRRKMIRNSIKPVCDMSDDSSELMSKRPEQLSVSEFVKLTNLVQENLLKRNS